MLLTMSPRSAAVAVELEFAWAAKFVVECSFAAVAAADELLEVELVGLAAVWCIE